MLTAQSEDQQALRMDLQTRTMDDSPIGVLFMKLLFSVLHSFSLAYFSLLLSNIVHNFLYVPVQDTNEAIQDVLALSSFLIGAAIFSAFYFLGEYWKKFELVGAITLIWTSGIPFLYFQYYHSGMLYWGILVFLFCGVRSTACVWHSDVDAFVLHYFALLVLALTPAIWAHLYVSPCRHMMVTEYILFLRYNSLGGLLYLSRLPEKLRLGLHTSRFALHLILVGSAVAYSMKLITAYGAPRMESNCSS
jgi:hypothetical protein